MKYNFLKSISVLTIVATCFVACVKERDNDAGGTVTENLAGEWWVQIKQNNVAVVPNWFKILTYNTADNVATKMWLDDFEHIWPFKFKIDVDPVAKTFTAANATSTYTNITVKLANGKILEDITKGPVSKAVTDSIYFEAEFSDDPGEVYQFTGYKRTRWPDDDH